MSEDAEREYEHELGRILAPDPEDEFCHDPKFGNGIKTFMLIAFVTAVCLLGYFGLVASY